MVLSALIIVVLILIIWRNMCKPVYWFFKKTCPYCVQMEDEWREFKYLTIFSMIKPIEIDITKPENKAICDAYDIKSVPTLIKIENKIPYIHNGPRTAQYIYQWAKYDQ